MAERVRKVVPEPVLHVVDECEEERGHERRGDPDQRTERDEPEVRGGGDLRLLGHEGPACSHVSSAYEHLEVVPPRDADGRGAP